MKNSSPKIQRLLPGVLALLALAACETPLSVDFEDYKVGSLGSPWSITGNTEGTRSKVSIENSPDHGKVLLLHGDPASPNFIQASLGFSSSASDIYVSVDIKPDAGATFIWSLQGAGSSIGARRIRLQRDPGSTTLVASTAPGGNTSCGTLASGVWSKVALIVHTAPDPNTYDVLINGATTACAGIKTGLGAPFSGVMVMDPSNDGYGGDVRFDNIQVTTP